MKVSTAESVKCNKDDLIFNLGEPPLTNDKF